MREDNVRVALFGLVIVFFAILFLFRKKLTYPFCTLEKYTGKINKGKSHCFSIVHLFLSFGLGIISYVILNNFAILTTLFVDTAIRLSSIVLLRLFWIFVVGWLIELYLQLTDKEYHTWKSTYLNNYH
jgi:hypothetical protein